MCHTFELAFNQVNYLKIALSSFYHSFDGCRVTCRVVTCYYSAICCQNGRTDREPAVWTVCHVPGLQALRNELFDCIWASHRPQAFNKTGLASISDEPRQVKQKMEVLYEGNLYKDCDTQRKTCLSLQKKTGRSSVEAFVTFYSLN